VTMLGMDTVAGRQVGETIASGSQQIADLAARLDTVMTTFEWFGSDAEAYRAHWSSQQRAQLDATSQALAAVATLIRSEADAQDTASGEATSSGGPVVGTATAAQGGGLTGWLDRHVGTFLRGMGRAGEKYADYLGKLGDVLTGEKEWSVTALAASAISTYGAAAGAVWGGVKGAEQGWFDDAPGLSGAPVAVPTDPSQAGQFRPVLTRPTDLPSLMQGVTDAYQVGSAPGSTGDVRITRVDNGTGTPAYVVSIPGTESWSPSAGHNAHDLTSNVEVVAGHPSAALDTVQRAMDRAGIPPGSPVMLVGHSQGGIVAAHLASDPAFVQRYGVTNVLTYGSPIDHVDIDPSVEVMQVAHGNDLVPKLDLGGVRAGFPPVPHLQPGVTLASPGGMFAFGDNHSYVNYSNSVREALGADTAQGRALRDYQAGLLPFLVGPSGTATAIDVPVSRDPRR